MPNPWTALERLDIVLERLPMADRGRYYHRDRVIVVRSGLAVVEERAVLWHELAHAVRGDRRCQDGVLEVRQEAAAWRYAARRSIPLRALLAALRWSNDTDEVADLLKTTPEMLGWRVKGLHPAERAECHRVVQGRS